MGPCQQTLPRLETKSVDKLIYDLYCQKGHVIKLTRKEKWE